MLGRNEGDTKYIRMVMGLKSAHQIPFQFLKAM